MNAPPIEDIEDEMTWEGLCEDEPKDGKCFYGVMFEHLTLACARTSGEACLKMATKWATIEALGIETDWTRGALLERACEKDQAQACWTLTTAMLQSSKTVPQSTYDLAFKSCRLGTVDACLIVTKIMKDQALAKGENTNDAQTLLSDTYCKAYGFTETECSIKFKEL